MKVKLPYGCTGKQIIDALRAVASTDLRRDANDQWQCEGVGSDLCFTPGSVRKEVIREGLKFYPVRRRPLARFFGKVAWKKRNWYDWSIRFTLKPIPMNEELQEIELEFRRGGSTHSNDTSEESFLWIEPDFKRMLQRFYDALQGSQPQELV